MNSPLRVLHVEDSPDDAELVAMELRRAGFELQALRVDTMAELASALESDWDLILCDYAVPGLEYEDAVAVIHATGKDIPYIIVSGAVGEEAAVAAMRDGAADYVFKHNLTRLAPCVVRELREADVRRARAAAERALLERAAQLRLVVEQLPALVWTTDRRLRLTSSQGAGLAQLGLHPVEGGDTEVSGYFRACGQSANLVQLHKRALHGESVSDEFTWGQHAFEVHVEPLHDLKTEIVGALGIALDISDRKRAEERAVYLAHHDALTGLPNRSAVQEELGRAIAYARRKDGIAALLFLDLDRFKTINDTLGHAHGDRILQSVAERLKGCLRESDRVGREGGDEFLVVLPDLQNDRSAAHVAEKILAACKSPITVAERELFVTASIGISMYPSDGETPEMLIRNADAAMYRAKAAGRNTFRYYTPDMQRNVIKRLDLETDLRHALERSELELFYQPMMNITTGEVTAAEALMRWRSPKQGVISPNEFIMVAEETGFIVPLGEWALYEACRQNREWQKAGLPKVRVAVNISARQFSDPGLRDKVVRFLRETGLNPGYLELELTESTVMTEAKRAARSLGALKDAGVRAVLDDFGTGYSSVGYLKRFPFSAIKIDRSFVRTIAEDAADKVIAQAVTTLAHGLGMRVTAEGVETSAQIALLRRIGCDEAQGHYLSKALPAAGFERFLRKHPVRAAAKG